MRRPAPTIYSSKSTLNRNIDADDYSLPTYREETSLPSYREEASLPSYRPIDNEDGDTLFIKGKMSSPKRPSSAPKTRGFDPPGSPNTIAPAAPDAKLKYMKTREKVLSKQLEDANELRKGMTEQILDLQRQLKITQEENKNLKKRIQILDIEGKRNLSRKPINEKEKDNNDKEELIQEISILRKDLQTAERIAKQGESIKKEKEVQLKRATEAISKLKAQVTELEAQIQGQGINDRSKADSTEQRLKIVERQRADLIAAFKKQMKLIDILKRQKVHIEAARLLAFTEEEFVKTLDWQV